ncbi:MAG: type II toxin-antitoxin system VapC family toxin [Myxococcales bacterium]
MTIVDTDVLIDFLSGKATRSVEAALARGNLATTAITAYELRRGARTEKAVGAVELLLAQMAEIVAFDDAAAAEAATVYRGLARSGQVIGKADLYIAGICLASEAQLVTRYVREYERVPGLDVVKS